MRNVSGLYASRGARSGRSKPGDHARREDRGEDP